MPLAQAKQLSEQFQAADMPANAPIAAALERAFAGGADDGKL